MNGTSSKRHPKFQSGVVVLSGLCRSTLAFAAERPDQTATLDFDLEGEQMAHDDGIRHYAAPNIVSDSPAAEETRSEFEPYPYGDSLSEEQVQWQCALSVQAHEEEEEVVGNKLLTSLGSASVMPGRGETRYPDHSPKGYEHAQPWTAARTGERSLSYCSW